MKIPIALLFALCLSAYGQAVRNLSGQATNLSVYGTGLTNTAIRIITNSVVTYDATMGTFASQVGQSTFNGVVDNALFYGYNYGANGNSINSSLPSIGLQIEADYYDGANHYHEWSLNSTTLTNGIKRWMAFSSDLNNPTNLTTYWNFYMGTGGNSQFAIVRQHDNIAMLRVIPTGWVYVNAALLTPSVIEPNGAQLLLRSGTNYTYIRHDVVGIKFSVSGGANAASLYQPTDLSAVNLIAGNAGSFVTLNTNGNFGIAVTNPVARLVVNGAGVFTNGVSSFSSITPVTIAATGWTNIWSTNNAIVHFDGATMFFTNVLRGNTPWYTNTTAHSGAMTTTLQPGEAIRIAGTSVVGRAKPF